jgi:hypothetical protein
MNVFMPDYGQSRSRRNVIALGTIIPLLQSEP